MKRIKIKDDNTVSLMSIYATLTKEEDFIVFDFPYDQELVTRVKEFSVRKYIKSRKVWKVKIMTEKDVQRFYDYIDLLKENAGEGQQLDIQSGVMEEVKIKYEMLKERMEASFKKHSDLIVPVPADLVYYPFQIAGIEFIEDIANGRVLLADDMGLGKTITSLGYLNCHPEYRPVLVITPATVKYNWYKEIKKWVLRNNSCEVVSSNDEFRGDGDFIVINYDIIYKDRYLNALKEIDFKTLIIDECFYYETPVITEYGLLSIGFLVENKLSIKVLSYNLVQKKLEFKKIEYWKSFIQTSRMVEIIHSKGKFVCTENHKIYTKEKGYVRAKELERDQRMLYLQENFYSKSIKPEVLFKRLLLQSSLSKDKRKIHYILQCLWKRIQNFTQKTKILFCELFCQMERSTTRNKEKNFEKIEEKSEKKMRKMWEIFCCNSIQKTKILFHELFGNMENGTTRNKKKDIYRRTKSKTIQGKKRYTEHGGIKILDEIKSRSGFQKEVKRSISEISQKQPIFYQKRGETQDNCSTENSFRSIGVSKGMDGIQSDSGGESKRKFEREQIDTTSSKLLSDRYCSLTVKNCNRSRWENSQNTKMEMDRCEKGKGVEFSRVESVEILERRSVKRFGWGYSRHKKVYNIEVEDNHNYFACGVLVSNSHYVKNFRAKRTSAVVKLSKKDSIEAVLCLTGTPVLNRPVEAFTMLNMLNPTIFASWYNYVYRYCNAHKTWIPTRDGGRYIWDVKGSSNTEELGQLLRTSVMIRRKKSEVLSELPDKVRTVIEVDIDSFDMSVLEQEIQRSMSSVISLKRKAKRKSDKELTEIYEEVASASSYTLELIEKYRQIVALEKLPFVEEHIDSIVEQGNKVVVFVYHRDIFDRLMLKYNKIAVGIKGGYNAEKKQEAIDKFQDCDDIKIFVGSIRASSEGITLTAASNVVFAEYDWTPARMRQAEDRIHRIGQKNCVNSYWIAVKDSIDYFFIQTILKKMQIIESITEAKEVDEKIDLFEEAVSYLEQK